MPTIDTLGGKRVPLASLSRTTTDPDALLDQTRVAQILNTTTKFLEARRCRGGGPDFVRVGRLVRYRPADIERWIESRCVSSTSE